MSEKITSKQLLYLDHGSSSGFESRSKLSITGISIIQKGGVFFC